MTFLRIRDVAKLTGISGVCNRYIVPENSRLNNAVELFILEGIKFDLLDAEPI